MLSSKEQITLHNSCSYKLLIEKNEDRNKKRISQFSKRKTALSTNKKGENKIINNFNLNKNEEKSNEKDVINIFNLIINGHNNEIKIEKNIIENIDHLNINFLREKSTPKKYNKIHFTPINNKMNKINNSINNNSLLNKKKENTYSNMSNNSILKNENINLNYDINKEVNISNLEEDKESLSNNIHKNNENNEFALKYLSSSNDSFVPFGNNLVTKAKIQKNYFTESYSQALGYDIENNNKIFNIKKLDDIEIIKEEKEADTPLKRNKNKNNEISNRLFSIRKKIRLLKEKRKSKSLTKELYLLNKKDKSNEEEIGNSIPNRNINNNKEFEQKFKKAKTKNQLTTNKYNKYQSKNIISLKKNKKNNKSININNDNYFLKNEINNSLTQKFSEIKMNITSQTKQNKSFMHTHKQFYNINNINYKKEKIIKKNEINYNNMNRMNGNSNINNYNNISNANRYPNSYVKRKKIKIICIREKKNNYNNNIYENSDNENNCSKNIKKNIILVKNKVNKINMHYPNDKKQNNNNEKIIKKNISKRNSRDIIKISSNKNQKSKIQSIKLINNYKFRNNGYIENNSNLLYNKLSPKKDKNTINKTSIQSPFNKNKIIKISIPKIFVNDKNLDNQNILRSNKINKKNISFFNEKEKNNNKNELKKHICISNKDYKLKRTIFINQKGIKSNYENYSRNLEKGKNINTKNNKILNNSDNNLNLEKSKENNSYYLYTDVNSL